MDKIATPLLDKVIFPQDIRKLSIDELIQLSRELRFETIATVAEVGGHLGASLGVVELTVALHYIFNTPDDKLIFDVGHQAYPHKIITGRRERIKTLRRPGGLSGFTSRAESVYDPFGAAHAGTSISAALGMVVGRDLSKKNNNVIAVVGDGAASSGMIYEAMNNAGVHHSRLIVILNDNDMSIAPSVGAMSAYLARLVSSHTYKSLRYYFKQIAKKLPHFVYDKAKKTEKYSRGFWTGGTLFEELGFYYVGPLDGHNLKHLLPVLKNVRDIHTGPVLVHVVTKKGKGYLPAEKSYDKYHGVKAFSLKTGQQMQGASKKTYTRVFVDSLLQLAQKDEKIVAITAAMLSGTGLDVFKYGLPNRVFDVGIAEQHAVTFAAGLATEGYKPYCVIYSTFLQRSYDQIIHDVAIQKLPVRFAIDRAGFVGADGATHVGAFDITFLAAIPNMVVMAAGDEAELVHMVATSAAYNDGPIAFRYPKAVVSGIEIPKEGEILKIGKGRIIQHGNKVAILSLGGRLQEVYKAAVKLNEMKLSTTIADARFAKPLDTELIKDLANNHELLITIEEGVDGGFGSRVLSYLNNNHLLKKIKFFSMTMPDTFQDHDDISKQYAQAKLNSQAIVVKVKDMLGIS